MAASEINIYIHTGDATMKSNYADLIGGNSRWLSNSRMMVKIKTLPLFILFNVLNADI